MPLGLCRLRRQPPEENESEGESEREDGPGTARLPMCFNH